MTTKTHVIEIYEPSEYGGPNPMRVSGIGVVHGPDKSEYYLLEVTMPFEYRGDLINQILVQPRYFGDKIDRAINDICTVGIIRVKPNVTLNSHEPFELSSSYYWGCGKICPMRVK